MDWDQCLKNYAKKYKSIERRYKIGVAREKLTNKENIQLKIVFWKDQCGQTFVELAAEHGLSERTVRTYYKAAKKILESVRE